MLATHSGLGKKSGFLLGGWQVKHEVQHEVLDDAPEAPGAQLLTRRPLSDRIEGLFGELQFDVLHLEQFLILFNDGILGLGEDVDQVLDG